MTEEEKRMQIVNDGAPGVYRYTRRVPVEGGPVRPVPLGGQGGYRVEWAELVYRGHSETGEWKILRTVIGGPRLKRDLTPSQAPPVEENFYTPRDIPAWVEKLAALYAPPPFPPVTCPAGVLEEDGTWTPGAGEVDSLQVRTAES